MSMPASDPTELSLGLQYFYSETPGLGGRLRKQVEDFIVDEISLPPEEAIGGRFTIATIKSRNWETNRLIRTLGKNLRMSRMRISFAGTKDKRAVSTQLICFKDVPPTQLEMLTIPDVTVTDAYCSFSPLEIGDLVGNRFDIVASDIEKSPSESKEIVDDCSATLLGLQGFPNFFGIQRFGSLRPVTHLIGGHILRGEYREAVMSYIGKPLKVESEEVQAARSMVDSNEDLRKAFAVYPTHLSFERSMIQHLIEKPGDYVGAIKRLPLNLQRMFIHAFQSFLFNRMLSERIQRGLPLNEPVEGDLIIPRGDRDLPDRRNPIEVKSGNIEKVTKQFKEGKAFVTSVVFGAKSMFAEGEPGEIERKALDEEEIRPEHFIIPEIPELSSSGIRREICAPVKDLESEVQEDMVRFQFSLNKGSYATCFLREFLKTSVANY